MHRLSQSLLLALLVNIGLIGVGCTHGGAHGPILHWHDDPTATMTITWVDRSPQRSSGEVLYRRVGTHQWSRWAVESRPFGEATAAVRRARLADLDPDTEYEFQLPDGVPIHADRRHGRFRTAPRRAPSIGRSASSSAATCITCAAGST